MGVRLTDEVNLFHEIRRAPSVLPVNLASLCVGKIHILNSLNMLANDLKVVRRGKTKILTYGH